MVKKKLLSVALVAVTVCSMIFTGCGSSAENTGNDTGKTDSDAQAGNTAGDVADVADDVEKPEKITIMVDGLSRRHWQTVRKNGSINGKN